MSKCTVTTSLPHKEGSLEYWREMAKYLSGLDKKHRKIINEFLEWIEEMYDKYTASKITFRARQFAYRACEMKYKQLCEKHGVKLEE